MRPKLIPLSQEAKEARKPAFNPVALLDSLQEPIHIDLKSTRPAKTSKRKK